jgi:hypothetical protein
VTFRTHKGEKVKRVETYVVGADKLEETIDHLERTRALPNARRFNLELGSCSKTTTKRGRIEEHTYSAAGHWWALIHIAPYNLGEVASWTEV